MVGIKGLRIDSVNKFDVGVFNRTGTHITIANPGRDVTIPSNRRTAHDRGDSVLSRNYISDCACNAANCLEKAFAKYAKMPMTKGKSVMKSETSGIWPQGASVLWTSFDGWDPERWGAVSFTDEGRRRTLLRELTDPFITICYVTGSSKTDPGLRGEIAGFYLTSHETGDRNDFIHPAWHSTSPDSWRYAFRALRAFSYLPEYRITAKEFDPTMIPESRARAVSRYGEIITDPARIDRLRRLPCVEVAMYQGKAAERPVPDVAAPGVGYVRGGPASQEGYTVAEGVADLPRELYVLKLEGDTAALLGRDPGKRAIYKIGLSVSPELRRQAFQKTLPEGAFRWALHRSSRTDGGAPYEAFQTALAGEDAMKIYLAHNADWLGGEFYLATSAGIDAAWSEGCRAAKGETT